MKSRTRRPVELAARELRLSAHDANVDIPLSYARKLVIASNELGIDLFLGELGNGIVFKSLPASPEELPLIMGYADKRGQWFRDGRKHLDQVQESETWAHGVIEL